MFSRDELIVHPITIIGVCWPNGKCPSWDDIQIKYLRNMLIFLKHHLLLCFNSVGSLISCQRVGMWIHAN